MKSPIAAAFVALFSLTAIIPQARAAWPDRVFAPYMYVGYGDDFKLTDCDDACGVKYYTIAFIIAHEQDGNYLKEPSWDGRIPIGQDFYKDQIDAIRKRGGDVIVSFGGEAGKEIADVIDDPAVLEADYQEIVTRYQLTWLDFDIEGDNLDMGKADSERRNTALADLQKKNPGLMISYTLPVDPHGLSQESLDLLTDAHAKGLAVRAVNIMVMYFGKEFIGKGKSEGELGIESANVAYRQIQGIDPAMKISLCPCLGRNGSRAEVFTLADAKTLRSFADKTPWVSQLTYWCINDDARGKAAAGRPYAFADLFKSFESGAGQ